MKTLLALVLACSFTACVSQPTENLQDPSQARAEAKQREEFAKTLPKPPER